MKLTTKNIGSNYLAKIVKLPKPFKHPNADKLQVVVIDHCSVITGLDAQEGALYVYFPLETAINKSFLSYTDSFSDATLNGDTTKKGFFNDKGRVRAVKLRGQASEGYIVPLHTVECWLFDTFHIQTQFGETEVGVEFDSFESDGSEIMESGENPGPILLCEKYVPFQQVKGPANTPKQKKEVRHNRIVDGQFRFHEATAQLKKNIHAIQPDDMISITYKMHGTSLVAARLLTNRKLKWYEKLARKFGVKVQDKEYGLVYSSRAVIKNQYDKNNYQEKAITHWYKEDIWGLASMRLEPALQDGISIYAEIVGFLNSGKAIQKDYDYGCAKGEFEVYVYRITSTNASGDVLEFTSKQIKTYCEKYGLKMVPWFYYGTARSFCDSNDGEDLLQELIKQYTEKKCYMCVNDVPEEGIVLTVERPQYTAYKLKSFAFFEKESKELDKGEIDIETSGEAGIIEPSPVQ